MLSTREGSRLDHIWLTLVCRQVTLKILGQFTRVAFLSPCILNNKIRPFQIHNLNVYTFSDCTRSPQTKSILNAHLPFLCLLESNLTQPSECHLKGKIICHPKSTLINHVWASASRIFSRIQDVCATCGFLGNTDNEVNGFSLTQPRPIHFSSKDDPFLDSNLLSG